MRSRILRVLAAASAVAGSPPSVLPCASAIVGAAACFEKAGDKIWVKDTRADGASAVFRWKALRNGERYRYGECINSMGNGKWGVCNKNFVEGVEIVGYVCTWDREVQQEPVPCGNDTNMGTAWYLPGNSWRCRTDNPLVDRNAGSRC